LILGLITITPVIFCVAWTLGTMYLVNIPLNMMTITIASLTIGLGITYGIHITHRFLEDLKNYNSKNHLMIQKRVGCPNCGEIVKVSGKPGEVIKVTCPSCATLGKVTFKKPISTTSYIDDACRSTVTHTGTALFGAAATTISGFGLLVFALLPPLQQFGSITALTILYSFLASVFILPTFLVVWAKWKQKNKCINF
jgi:predicted RND superfamily exporter protein